MTATTDSRRSPTRAWFTAQPDLAVEATERAFKRKFSIAAAWAARGERILNGGPQGSADGYLAWSETLVAEHACDIDQASRTGR
jgi:hypothetical protein